MQRRKEVNWFADQMEKVLQANDHKGGWRNCYIRDMLIRIPEEYTELVEAVVSGDIDRIVSEAADVANFSLMVADLAYRYGVPNTARVVRPRAAEHGKLPPNQDDQNEPEMLTCGHEAKFLVYSQLRNYCAACGETASLVNLPFSRPDTRRVPLTPAPIEDYEGEDVTWCQDKINDTDVSYVRSDLYEHLLQNYKNLQEKLFGTHSPERWSDILKELGI